MPLSFKNILHRNDSTFKWATRKISFTDAYNTFQVQSLNEIKNKVLQFYNEELANEMTSDEKSKIIWQNVNNILDEIACFYNEPLIRSLGFLFSKILENQFSGLYVNEENLLKAKAKMPQSPFIFVPTHRSYADFILMAFVCFNYDLHVPSVAAGIDFKGMKVIGYLLKYCKAFFIRRGFAQDKMYKSVIQRYIQQMVVKSNFPIEFFIEGTRSRTGKALSPKFGLMKIILETYHHGDVPDITFLPVCISYDRILEDVLFCYEVLGVPKPKESTSGFFKAVRMFSENYGNVFVNFGETISLKKFMETNGYHSYDKANCETLLEDLGYYILKRQKNLQVITCVNLLCLVLNVQYVRFGKISTTFQEACDFVLSHSIMVTHFGGNVHLVGDVSIGISECLRIHKSFLSLNESNDIQFLPVTFMPNYTFKELRGAELEPEIMKEAIPVLKMHLYTNPLLSILGSPALILLLAEHRAPKPLLKDDLLTEFLIMKKIFKVEFSLDYDSETENYEKLLQQLQELKLINIVSGIVRVIKSQFCYTLVYLLYPFLITYQCTFNFLSKDPLLQKSSEHILQGSQRLIQERVVKKYHYHHASLSLDIIAMALDSLLRMNIVNKFIVDGALIYKVDDTSSLKKINHKMSSLLAHFDSCWRKNVNYNAPLVSKL